MSRVLAKSQAHYRRALTRLPLGVASNFRFWGEERTIYVKYGRGARIVDNGPPPKRDHREKDENRHRREAREKRAPMAIEGVVRRALHGPKGETRGALLEDGRIVRFPPHEAPHLKALLERGATLAARGEGLATPFGTVIEAREIGPSAAALQPVKAKAPKPDRSRSHEAHA